MGLLYAKQATYLGDSEVDVFFLQVGPPCIKFEVVFGLTAPPPTPDQDMLVSPFSLLLSIIRSSPRSDDVINVSDDHTTLSDFLEPPSLGKRGILSLLGLCDKEVLAFKVIVRSSSTKSVCFAVETTSIVRLRCLGSESDSSEIRRLVGFGEAPTLVEASAKSLLAFDVCCIGSSCLLLDDGRESKDDTASEDKETIPILAKE